MSINWTPSFPLRRTIFAMVACVIAYIVVAVGSPVLAQDDAVQHAANLRKMKQAVKANQPQEAVALLDDMIESDADFATAYYFRGREQFKLNQIEKSVEDFDKYVQLKPELATSQWERGISLYYAGRFEDGAKQFKDYQSYHSSDVENSVWRFLCVTQADDLETARKNMLEINNDPRVPMMKIYQMYRGECEPDDVLSEASAGDPSAAEKNQRLFYAHLYIGLYEEACDNRASAQRHLRKSVGHKIDHYMWNVADVHVKRKYED